MPSLLEQKQAQFRTALLKQERQAASQMVRYYGQAWQRIQAEIATLVKKYNASDNPSPYWLYQMERLQNLRRQVQTELLKYSRFAEKTIRAQQAEAMRRAGKDAVELIKTAYSPAPAGATLIVDRLPARAIEEMIGTFQAGSPVHQRLLQLAAEGAQAVEDGLVQGLTLGRGAVQIARDIQEALGRGLGKALVWSRTETLRAYRTSTLQTYRANRDIVPGWIRRCARNERTCAACWALDGKEYALEDSMDDHPCGRCFMTPKTKTWRELGFDIDEVVKPKESGVEAFEKLPEAMKAKILGPSKYGAYKAGDIKLVDLVGTKADPVWGVTKYEKSLKELGIDAGKYAEQALGEEKFVI